MKLKKIALLLGGALALFVVTSIAVPLLVDVDRYRPQIVEKANSMINGRIELGKLKLSLWGRVKVDVAGIQLEDSKHRKVVSVADASFVLPFASILAGSPRLTLVMQKPSIAVLRDSNGELNVMTLVKRSVSSEEASGSAPGAASSPKASGSVEVRIPAVVARARLGIEIRDGSLQYLDERSRFESTVDGLQVRLQDASITQPTRLSVEARLDTKVGQQVRVTGPVRFALDTTPVISGMELQEMGASLQADAGDLQIEVPGLFLKKKGVPLSLQGKLALGGIEARIDSLTARFHNAELSVSGKIDQLSAEPRLALKVSTNAIELQPWGELVPMLQTYQLSGKTTLGMDVGGSTHALNYGGKIQLDAIGFTHPLFKANPRIDGSIRVTTNQFESIELTMKAPGSELRVGGRLVDFLKPRITLEATSPGMDLDQWIDLSKSRGAAKGVAASSGSAAPTGAPGAAGAAVERDLDALLDPMRKNPIALATEARLAVRLEKFKAYQAPMSNVNAVATMKDLVVNLDPATLNVFDGRVAASARLDMRPVRPTYSFSAKVDGLQIAQAIESQLSFLKNTLLGRLSATASGSGSSFNVEPAIRGLGMKGTFEVRQARFATLDVTKMAFEGINGAIAKASEKVPALKGRQLGAPGGRESAYEFVRSSFQLSGGKFSAPDFEAKAEPNKGIDLRGRVAVDIKDLTLDTKFELIDTYNVTKARDVSVEVAGVPVQNVLAEKGRPVTLPISLGCQVAKPCPSYGELPEHFARVALANLTGSAKEKVKSEAKKQIGDAIKKSLPGGLKGLFR